MKSIMLMRSNERVLRPGRVYRDERRRENLPPVIRDHAGWVSSQPGGVSFGGDTPATANQAAISEMDFDEKIVGATGSVSNGEQPGQSSGAFALAAIALALRRARCCALRGDGHFSAPAKDFHVSQPRFVVAGVDDLKTTPIGENGTIKGGQSFTAVQQALDIHLKANPQAKGRLQVVPAFQAEETE